MEKLENYIEYYQNLVPIDLCKQIIDEYSNSKNLEEAAIVEGMYKDERNCLTLNMSSDHIISKSLHRKDMDTKLYNYINEGYTRYTLGLPQGTYSGCAQFADDTGYEFLQYNKYGKFREHTDNYRGSNRALSVSLLLNDEFQGGEFVFFAGEKNQKVIKQTPGSVLFFPSNFLYPHQVMPIYEGTRYSVVSWFI